jgi:methylated-DNA-[protein]-cysteine S-methyltransferase
MKHTNIHPPAFCLRETPFGPVAALWSIHESAPKIFRIVLSGREISIGSALKKFCPDAVASSCAEINILADQIEALTNGANIEFPLAMVRLDLYSAFQQKVLCANYAVPRGGVSTYKLVAKRLGNPGAVRAVGTALATNPFPIVIPCHRVIRSDGSLGGYGGGLEMKRRLLEMEGVVFCDAGNGVAGGSGIRVQTVAENGNKARS